MIVQYEETSGRIFHIIDDPVPASIVEFLTDSGAVMLNLQPVPKSSQQVENPATGEVVDVVSEWAEPKVDIATDYVDLTNLSICPRPNFDLPNDVSLSVGEERRFYGLPTGINVTFDGLTETITDGVVEISAEMPAQYELTFDYFPYMPHTMKVRVNEN